MDILTGFLWLSLNIYHEARGEDQLAQVAVAHVTINRARKRGLSVKETVLQPKQFSWTNQPKEKWWPRDWFSFLLCMESATVAVAGYDFTKGATHYHSYRVIPGWSKKLEYIGAFGGHKFYRRAENDKTGV